MRHPRFYHISLLILAVACLFASYVLVIKDNKATLVIMDFEMNPSVCIVKEITSVDCPTCGLSRAFISISGLNISKSLYYNPSGILVYILFLYQIPYRIYMLCRYKHTMLWYIINRILVIVSILVIFINWIYKIITWNYL